MISILWYAVQNFNCNMVSILFRSQCVIRLLMMTHPYHNLHICVSADAADYDRSWCCYFAISGISLYNAPSQWETSLHCNAVSHWLGAYLHWSLLFYLVVPQCWCKWWLCRYMDVYMYKLHGPRTLDPVSPSSIGALVIVRVHMAINIHYTSYKMYDWPVA